MDSRTLCHFPAHFLCVLDIETCQEIFPSEQFRVRFGCLLGPVVFVLPFSNSTWSLFSSTDIVDCLCFVIPFCFVVCPVNCKFKNTEKNHHPNESKIVACSLENPSEGWKSSNEQKSSPVFYEIRQHKGPCRGSCAQSYDPISGAFILSRGSLVFGPVLPCEKICDRSTEIMNVMCNKWSYLILLLFKLPFSTIKKKNNCIFQQRTEHK